MRHAASVTMSMRELDRLKCIQAVVDGDLSPGIAADRLGVSTRQLRRIAQRYRMIDFANVAASIRPRSAGHNCPG